MPAKRKVARAHDPLALQVAVRTLGFIKLRQLERFATCSLDDDDGEPVHANVVRGEALLAAFLEPYCAPAGICPPADATPTIMTPITSSDAELVAYQQ